MSGYDYVINNDAPHLGGNIWQGDPWTFAPTVWGYMIDRFAGRALLDVGSGRGHAANWFSRRGVQVVAMDAEPSNVDNALYPTVLHDLTKGPFLTKVDMVHCQEVVEHIEPRHIHNLMTTLTSGPVVVISHAGPGQIGHHHVNCQPQEYWVKQFDHYNYAMLTDDTIRVRDLASQDKAHHLARSGLVFARRK